MPIKVYKPTSAGRRNSSVLDFSHLTKKKRRQGDYGDPEDRDRDQYLEKRETSAHSSSRSLNSPSARCSGRSARVDDHVTSRRRPVALRTATRIPSRTRPSRPLRLRVGL